MSGADAAIAVIGGGPAGAAAACRLAEAGRAVLVLERSASPEHKVCGEFISTEAVSDLRALGVDVGRLGAARIERVRLISGAAAAEAPLPTAAAGLSRRAMDAALLARAAASGAEIRRGAQVRRLERTARGTDLVLADGSRLRAKTVLIATGKRDLPGARRATRWRGREDMLGLKMHFRLAPEAGRALARHVELHLFPGGYAGLQPVENGWANLCMAIDRALLVRVNGDFGRLLEQLGAASPRLAATLAGARAAWPRPLAIARVPYGHLHRREAGSAWRLGDQAAVTPSFTGDGLAIAVRSGILAADHLLAGRSQADFATFLRWHAGRQMRWAMLFQAVVDRPHLHLPAVGLVRHLPRLIEVGFRETRLRPVGPAIAACSVCEPVSESPSIARRGG